LSLKWWQITSKYTVTPISVFLDHRILLQSLHPAADGAPVYPERIGHLINRHRLLALTQQGQNLRIQAGTALHNLSPSENFGMVAVRRIVGVDVELHPDVLGGGLGDLEVAADDD